MRGIGSVSIFLKKNDNEDAEIISLEGKLEPAENTNLEFEWALGKEDKEYDNAYLVNFHGSRNWIS